MNERPAFTAGEQPQKRALGRWAGPGRAAAHEHVRLIWLRQITNDHGAGGRRIRGVGGELVQVQHERVVTVLVGSRHVVGRVATRKPDRALRTDHQFEQFALVRAQAAILTARHGLFRFFVNFAQQLSIDLRD